MKSPGSRAASCLYVLASLILAFPLLAQSDPATAAAMVIRRVMAPRMRPIAISCSRCTRTCSMSPLSGGNVGVTRG